MQVNRYSQITFQKCYGSFQVATFPRKATFFPTWWEGRLPAEVLFSISWTSSKVGHQFICSLAILWTVWLYPCPHWIAGPEHPCWAQFLWAVSPGVVCVCSSLSGKQVLVVTGMLTLCPTGYNYSSIPTPCQQQAGLWWVKSLKFSYQRTLWLITLASF